MKKHTILIIVLAIVLTGCSSKEQEKELNAKTTDIFYELAPQATAYYCSIDNNIYKIENFYSHPENCNMLETALNSMIPMYFGDEIYNSYDKQIPPNSKYRDELVNEITSDYSLRIIAVSIAADNNSAENHERIVYEIYAYDNKWCMFDDELQLIAASTYGGHLLSEICSEWINFELLEVTVNLCNNMNNQLQQAF